MEFTSSLSIICLALLKGCSPEDAAMSCELFISGDSYSTSSSLMIDFSCICLSDRDLGLKEQFSTPMTSTLGYLVQPLDETEQQSTNGRFINKNKILNYNSSDISGSLGFQQKVYSLRISTQIPSLTMHAWIADICMCKCTIRPYQSGQDHGCIYLKLSKSLDSTSKPRDARYSAFIQSFVYFQRTELMYLRVATVSPEPYFRMSAMVHLALTSGLRTIMDQPQVRHRIIPNLSLEQFNTPYLALSCDCISFESLPKRCSSHFILFSQEAVPPLLCTSKKLRYLESEMKLPMSLSKSKWIMIGASFAMNSLIEARSPSLYPKCFILVRTNCWDCRCCKADFLYWLQRSSNYLGVSQQPHSYFLMLRLVSHMFWWDE